MAVAARRREAAEAVLSETLIASCAVQPRERSPDVYPVAAMDPTSSQPPVADPVFGVRQSPAIMLSRGTRRTGRMVTTPLRLRPSFLIIGAQKSGTTSLYEYLAAHPRMNAAETKEIHYFTVHAHRSLGYYWSFFPFGRSGHVTGEATPQYLYHPQVPQRVAKALPDVRLIVLLRDPVRRAISHHNQQLARGFDDLPLPEALRTEPARIGSDLARLQTDPFHPAVAMRMFSYVDRGRYARQLARWFDVFPRERFLILPSEPFFIDPAEAYARALEFLDLEPHPLHTPEARNAREYAAAPDPEVVDRLAHTFAPENERLFEMIGERYAWTRPR